MKGGYIYWKPKGGKKKPKNYQTVAKVIYAWSLSAMHVLIHNLKLRRKHALTTGPSSKAKQLWMRTGWKQFLAPDTVIWDPTPSPASVWTSRPYFIQPGLLLISLCHWERPSLVAKWLQISFITLALQLPKCPSCELIYKRPSNYWLSELLKQMAEGSDHTPGLHAATSNLREMCKLAWP